MLHFFCISVKRSLNLSNFFLREMNKCIQLHDKFHLNLKYFCSYVTFNYNEIENETILKSASSKYGQNFRKTTLFCFLYDKITHKWQKLWFMVGDKDASTYKSEQLFKKCLLRLFNILVEVTNTCTFTQSENKMSATDVIFIKMWNINICRHICII